MEEVEEEEIALIRAVKNHPISAMTGAATLAYLGFALATIAFPHFGAHLPKALKKPNPVPCYLLGGMVVLVVAQIVKPFFTILPNHHDHDHDHEKRIIKNHIRDGLASIGVWMVGFVALFALAKAGPSFAHTLQNGGKTLSSHPIQAVVISSTAVLATGLVLGILGHRRKKHD